MPGIAIQIPEERQPLLPEKARTELSSQYDHQLTPLHGYTLMFFAAICEAMYSLLFQTAEMVLAFSPTTSLLLGATIYLILAGFYIHRYGILKDFSLTRRQIILLFLRSFCAALSVYLDNLALARIPLGTVLTIFATTPAVTAFLAAIFLGESLTFVDGILLFVNITGVVLVARPSTPVLQKEELLGVLSSVAAMLVASVGYILLKSMGRTVHFMFHVGGIGVNLLLISLLMMTVEQYQQIWQLKAGTALAVSGGIFGFLLKVCVNSGMQVTNPGHALVIRSFNVPIGFFLGLIFLGESMDLISGVGVALVLGSVAWTAFQKL